MTEEDSLGHKSTPSTTQLEIEQSPKTDEQEEKIQNNESDTYVLIPSNFSNSLTLT